MAIKPVDNETFYREVDEELRREQMTQTWRRFAPLIVGGVLLLLVALGGFIYWQNTRSIAAEQRSEQLTRLFEDIEAGRTEGIPARLDQLAAEGGPGYRAAALLTKADMALSAGDDAAAAAAFKAVAGDEDLAAPYRELALIRQTTVEFDKLPPAEVIARLGPLARPGSPWFGSAGELVGIAHLKAGRRAEAGRVFAAMAKDQAIPASLRSRALQMASALGVDAIEDGTATGAVPNNKEASE